VPLSIVVQPFRLERAACLRRGFGRQAWLRRGVGRPRGNLLPLCRLRLVAPGLPFNLP